jgi:signal transduction histidine kinase
LRSMAGRAGVPVELELDLHRRLPAATETAAYYVVSEALTNVSKYACASHAFVHARNAAGQLAIEVGDDGVGGADAERGSGLRGLADRVSALGGRLEVSSPPGGGTCVRAELPCDADVAPAAIPEPVHTDQGYGLPHPGAA